MKFHTEYRYSGHLLPEYGGEHGKRDAYQQTRAHAEHNRGAEGDQSNQLQRVWSRA
jgi:hypothetical protein